MIGLTKKCLITGGAGFIGSQLARRLLAQGHEVTVIDNLFTGSKANIYDLMQNPRFTFLIHDVTQPFWGQFDEIYNLGAQSHVKVSFEVPEYTADVDAIATLRFLDAIKDMGLTRQVRFYQASTSELFGKVQEIPQKETTPFYPRSPYAVAKQYAYWIVINYREAYGIFASNGILFNHESERRGETFVTRKITRAAGRIKLGLQDRLVLGNMDSKRDWGYAPEYAEGMWRILQAQTPGEYVLATNETHTVREFAELAFARLGMEIEWVGKEENEKGICKKTGKIPCPL